MNEFGRILFGASGRLGRYLQKEGTFFTPSHEELDIVDIAALQEYLSKHKPQVIINCAALVGARECEERKEEAYRTNVLGVQNLADVCLKRNIRLVHISTDSVFDGEKGNYNEKDLPNPLNYYSLTKLLGECSAQAIPDSLVIRTSFFDPKNFPYAKALTDQYTSRMPVDKLAKEIMLAIDKKVCGVLHIGGERTSLYKIAKKINPSVGKMTRRETGLNLPGDLCLNSEKWGQIKNGP